MSKRPDRLEVLRNIIQTKEIETQDALQSELSRAGYKVTQATLSRDLRLIKATKVMMGSKYQYILPENPLYKRVATPGKTPENIRVSSGFVSIDFSKNLAVIHTRRGYASGLATDIDRCRLTSIVGTVAGDDTIIIVIDENCSRQEFVNQLGKVIPTIKNLEL